MSTDLLFEHFATLATAPDGIARLREVILQLAVQGKLDTQNPEDEPASKLLEKIQKEKTRLIKNGDIKRTDQFLPVDPEECQYEIPDGWQWTRLGTLVADSKQDIVDGPFGSDLHSAEYVDSGVPVIRLQNVQRNQFLNKNIRFLTSDKAEYLSRHNFVSGDIVITKLGEPVGKACIVPEYLKSGIFVADIIRIRLDSRFLDTNYITFMINSPFISVKFNGLVKGITRARVNLTKVREMVIPLPPLAEQHRIVAKVDRLMTLCDELEARQQQERAGCLRLGIASLAGLQNAASPEEFEAQWAQVCDAFDLILDCPENVGVLRQTILQLAVQGKLGTQNEADEPANQILLKIKREDNQKKTRVTRKTRHLNLNELSELPNGWVWTTLDKIAELKGGITKDSSRVVEDGRVVPYLRVANVQNGFLDLRVMKHIEASNSVIAELSLKKGDILFTEGGDRDKLGRGWIWQDELPECIYQNHIFRARLYLKEISPRYISWYGYTQSQNYFMKKGKQTTNLASINMTQLSALPVALPPLAEQHRIVTKVDALMALCDELEARLKERAAVQGKFAGAVVKTMAG
jgi:type I restriction enzyme S subunit